MQRPGSVPKSARYSSSDGWWEVGDVKKGRPFGPWKAYRGDGSPLFEARFDGKGRLQGTYKRFHPDGTLAREATYAQGVPTGQTIYVRAKGAEGDLFPCGDPRVWQVIVHHDKHGKPAKRELLDGKGREVVAGGAIAADAGALDTVFAAAQPDGFLATEALATVAKALPAALPPERDDFLIARDATPRKPLDAARYADLYGRPMPPALRAWLEAPPAKLLGIRVVRDAELDGAANQIEALIAEHQAAPGRAPALRELVSGTIAIGETPAGDRRYALAICESTLGENLTDAVYAIAPAEDAIEVPVARTLDDFAYAVALTSAADAGAVSLGCLRPAYQRLRGRVALRAPMTAIEARALGDDEDDEVVGDPQGDHREGFRFRRGQKFPVYFYYRCRWLLRLLCGHADGAAADFDPKLDGGLDDKRFELIRTNAPKEPWVAFYWLFRSYTFDDPRLDTLLRACSDTPSRLVRDVALLVRELAQGRKRLGAVDDLPAVKARFRALDPLAKKPEAEEEQEEEPPPPLAATVPAELAPAAAVIDWAKNNGYSRENLLIKDEVEAAALGLALRADPRIVDEIAKLVDASPWLAERFLDPWLDGDRGNLAALVPAARAWIASQAGGSVYRWTAASKVLARAGGRDDAALIAKVLEPAFDSFFGRGQGFDSAMALMVLQEAIGPMCDALATLGVPASFVPALEGVVSAETHLIDDARGDCALALASAGVGLDAIVAGVRGQIARKHGHRIGAGQLLAIGTLGARSDRRDELAALIADIDRIGDEPKVAKAIALRDLGRDVDAVAAVREGLAKRRYSNSDTRKQRVFLLDLFARRHDLPAELAEPYVVDDDILVHRAAVRALRAHGAAVPATNLYDPMRIAAMSRDEIHAALGDDRGLYRSNLGLWLGDHPDPASREPLAAAARRLAADKEFPKEGPRHYELRWIVRALLAIGNADDVLDELLRSGNDNVAEPVLRYPDRITIGMARGMANVFATGKHWKQNVAKQWLAKHKQDPAIARALAEHGLAVEDVSRTEEDA